MQNTSALAQYPTLIFILPCIALLAYIIYRLAIRARAKKLLKRGYFKD